jgi:hypothetical protein
MPALTFSAISGIGPESRGDVFVSDTLYLTRGILGGWWEPSNASPHSQLAVTGRFPLPQLFATLSPVLCLSHSDTTPISTDDYYCYS